MISDTISEVDMSDKKAVIKNADMSEEMQQVLLDLDCLQHIVFVVLLVIIDQIETVNPNMIDNIIGCSRLCDGGFGEIQCGEGHRRLHQEGDGQKVGS